MEPYPAFYPSKYWPCACSAAARCDDFPERNDSQSGAEEKSSGSTRPAGIVSMDWRHNKHGSLAVASSFAFCPSGRSFLFPATGAEPVCCLPARTS